MPNRPHTDPVDDQDPPSAGTPRYDEVETLRERLSGMERAMESRAVIEQAVGVLAAVHSIDTDTAFQHLVRLSQHHNIKLRRMAVVLVGLTAEAGPATASAVVRRLHNADPLIELTVKRNAERGHPLDQRLPRTVIDAARALVTAHDAIRTAGADTDLADAELALYAELVRLGWVPPLPIPTELADAIDHHLDTSAGDHTESSGASPPDR